MRQGKGDYVPVPLLSARHCAYNPNMRYLHEEQVKGRGIVTRGYPVAKRSGKLSEGKFKEMRTFFHLQGMKKLQK